MGTGAAASGRVTSQSSRISREASLGLASFDSAFFFWEEAVGFLVEGVAFSSSSSELDSSELLSSLVSSDSDSLSSSCLLLVNLFFRFSSVSPSSLEVSSSLSDSDSDSDVPLSSEPLSSSSLPLSDSDSADPEREE